MQFRLAPKYHELLIVGVEWQADSVFYNGGRGKALAPFVRVVDGIRAAVEQPDGLMLTEIADEDLEIATGAMEAYYDHDKDTFFIDEEACINLIQMLRNAEDICCLAVGKKPPERASLPVFARARVRRS